MTKRVPLERLITFGAAFMTKRGVPDDRARYVSRIAVETEAYRQSTHGLAQFAMIDMELGEKIDPEAEPTVLGESGASVWLDGARCLGTLAMKRARETVMEMARSHGTGFAGVRNTHWLGALGMHLIPVPAEGLLCQAWAQTNTCKDCAPFGGVEARLSTNPIALAFPTEENPVVADFSTATLSMGGAHALVRGGETSATPRFLDRDGNPSCDPSVIDRGGTLMLMGGDTDGHKGFALSLFNEALTALAGGNANNPDVVQYQSFSLMVLDPAAFGGVDNFLQEMRRFLDHVRSARTRPGGQEIRLPGERGFANLADCRIHGVPLDDEKLDMLRKLAERNEIEAIV